jgi:predicted DNA-binding protein
MTDRPHAFTVDFGSVLHQDLADAAAMLEKPKSELVREAVEQYLKTCNTISLNRKVKNIKTGREEVTKVIKVYNDVFFPGTDGPRHFYPAIITTVKQARKGGLSMEDICELIRISPQHSFIKDQVNSGVPPPVSSILSAKMIAALLVLQAKVEEKETTMSANDLVEYKYDMLDKFFDSVLDKDKDSFRESLLACETEKEVEEFLESYDFS